MVTMVENRVDLILLDLSMTPMDGLTFLQLFRRNVEWDNIPVIVMTGLSDGASFRHARQRGADKFIVKGQVAPADLLKHIQRRLGTQELLNAPGDGPDAFGGGSAFL